MKGYLMSMSYVAAVIASVAFLAFMGFLLWFTVWYVRRAYRIHEKKQKDGS